MMIEDHSRDGQESPNVAALQGPPASNSRATRAYVSPAILSHSGEDILEELGPAQACYPFNSCGITP